jgi:glucose/arabinose dehydrogenase
MRRKRAVIRVLIVVAALGALFSVAISRAPAAEGAVTLPPGFGDQRFASGFGGLLTMMTFAPDGRLFVSEKEGAIRIVKNGNLLTRPFLTLSTNSDSEHGVKGIAFDPAYATNRYVYVYYTDPVTIMNKVSRFRTRSDDPDVADAASETVLIDDIGADLYHNGGALEFGPDGKLYISTGYGIHGQNAQSLAGLYGKILRINSDGSIPVGNPYVGQTGIRPEIWASGLRNPYNLAFDAPSGRMFIEDVGYDSWEEINTGRAGANYGWPACEGACHESQFADPLYAYNHDGPGKAITGAVFYRGAMFPADFDGDFFFGDYVGEFIKRYDVATGHVSDFASGTPTPVDLDVGPDGALYYLSVNSEVVHRIAYGGGSTPTPTPAPSATASPPSVSNLILQGDFETTSTTWPQPWSLKVRAPAAAQLTRDTATRSSGTASARINVSARDVDWSVQLRQRGITLDAGTTYRLTFSARASSNRTIGLAIQQRAAPYGDYFQGREQVSTGWATHTLDFRAPVSDADGLLSIDVGDTTGQVWLDKFWLAAVQDRPPTPRIDLPVAGTTFRAGDQIRYSGGATDHEDGQLPASRLRWEIVFHHDTHTHPFIEPLSGVTGGSFVAPDTGEASPHVWYRIHLRATDSAGHASEVTRDVVPLTSNVTLASQPAGLTLELDASPVKTTYTFEGVVGFLRELRAPTTQSLNGTTYRFVRWSDFGSQQHTIATPGSDTTITAIYQSSTDDVFPASGFETSGTSWLSPWRFVVRTPASAAITRDTSTSGAGAASARIVVTSPSLDWHAQLQRPNVSLVAGLDYTLSFYSRASSDRLIRVAFQRNTSPYTKYFDRVVAVGTGWHRYTITFTAPATDSHALMNFNFGADRSTVWIDAVSLTR